MYVCVYDTYKGLSLAYMFTKSHSISAMKPKLRAAIMESRSRRWLESGNEQLYSFEVLS